MPEGSESPEKNPADTTQATNPVRTSPTGSQEPGGNLGSPDRKSGWIWKAIAGVVLIIIILAGALIITLNVTVTNTGASPRYPFITKYSVSFPEGQPVTVGNTRIIVLSFENEMISDIDGNREKLVVGEEKLISSRHARITTLGFVPLIDTDFQIFMKYKGVSGNLALFDIDVRTSNQVPDILIQRVLPPGIQARPS